MVPTPRDREKKLCPRAAAKASGVSFEKSGCTRYFRPSPAPGSVMEYTAMTTISTKRTGMVILLNLSMPFLTPAKTIPAVIPRKSRRQAMTLKPDAVNSPNIPVTASTLSGWNWMVRDLYSYSTDHPPTTL